MQCHFRGAVFAGSIVKFLNIAVAPGGHNVAVTSRLRGCARASPEGPGLVDTPTRRHYFFCPRISATVVTPPRGVQAQACPGATPRTPFFCCVLTLDRGRYRRCVTPGSSHPVPRTALPALSRPKKGCCLRRHSLAPSARTEGFFLESVSTRPVHFD